MAATLPQKLGKKEQQEEDLMAMTQYQSIIEPTKYRKFIKNSDPVSDSTLDQLVQVINRRSAMDNNEARINNFERYQKIWHNNL